MILHFKKGIKSSKLKRWYPITSQNSIYEVGWYLHPQEFKNLESKLVDAGFLKYMHRENLNRTRYGTYKRVRLFLYFQSPIEEARFMLWASGGVSV